MNIDHNHPPRPFDRSYWAAPGLLAGFLPWSPTPEIAAAYRRGLIDCGVGYVLNLMEEEERIGEGSMLLPRYDAELCSLGESAGIEVVCRRIGVRDMGVPTRPTMRLMLDSIDEALAAGRRTYVHCLGGKGRTGTVIGCWLARHGAATGREVLALLTELRRPDPHAIYPSPETDPQRELVISWNVGE